ncbi:hypothetical protein LB504_000320 [Fusarium proliferatum]|nr:hypothetical protein LB504_000320 [Fusarium proliferatum]
MTDLGPLLRRWIAQSGADESVTWLAHLGQDPYRGEGRADHDSSSNISNTAAKAPVSVSCRGAQWNQ